MLKFFSSLLVWVGFFVAVVTVETSMVLAFIGICIAGLGGIIADLINRYENY